MLPAPEDSGPPVAAAAAGGCADCRSGEWAARATAVAGPGGDCPPGLTAAARTAAENLGGSLRLELASFAGSAAGALSVAEPAAGRAFAELLRGTAGGPCQPIAVVIPKTAGVVGFRLAAGDAEGAGTCPPDGECALGAARWVAGPEIVRAPGAIVVLGVFRNLATDRERRGQLTVYFRPPSSRWRPPGG